MNLEQSLLTQLVIWLNERNGKIQRISDRAIAIISDMSVYYKKIDGGDLERILKRGQPSVVDLLESNAFIYLQPIDKDGWLVPIMSIKFDFQGDTPHVCLRTALFLSHEMNGKPVLKAIGFRYESPEGPGLHNFYHVQPIIGFAKNRWRLPGPDWIPTSCPCFPLDAKNSVHLFVCVLVSLYGMDFIKDLQSAPFWNQVKSYLQNMRISTN
jgi:hypothetical protein